MRSYSNKGAGLNIIFMAAIVIIAAVVGLVIAGVTVGKDDNVQSQSNERVVETGPQLPVASLEGTWSAERNGSQFVATVTPKNIQIKFVADKTSMIYWNGSFETPQSPVATIPSKKVEINKLVMSQATSKNFTYDNGKLSFEFEAMGMTTVVELQRV